MQYASKEDLSELREDLRIHSADDRAFQERMFGYLRERFDKVDGRLQTLWDESQQRKGAITGFASAEAASTKTAERRGKLVMVAGWTFNAFIAAATAYWTIYSSK